MTIGGLAASLEESFATGIAAGQNNLPEVMRRFNRGDFDLVGVARAILADPAWVEKARSGGPFLPFTADMLGRLE